MASAKGSAAATREREHRIHRDRYLKFEFLLILFSRQNAHRHSLLNIRSDVQVLHLPRHLEGLVDELSKLV